MIRILTIDFDYFIDASNEERDKYFPRLTDDHSDARIIEEWAETDFRNYDGVIDQYYEMMDILREMKKVKKPILTASSKHHRGIIALLDRLPRDKALDIVNVDHHHDLHLYLRHKALSASWIEREFIKRWDRGPRLKDCPLSYSWIRREDSDQRSLVERDYKTSLDLRDIYPLDYDIVHICFSSECSPLASIDKYRAMRDLVLEIASPLERRFPKYLHDIRKEVWLK